MNEFSCDLFKFLINLAALDVDAIKLFLIVFRLERVQLISHLDEHAPLNAVVELVGLVASSDDSHLVVIELSNEVVYHLPVTFIKALPLPVGRV